jgi:hypothetical protein
MTNPQERIERLRNYTDRLYDFLQTSTLGPLENSTVLQTLVNTEQEIRRQRIAQKFGKSED